MKQPTCLAMSNRLHQNAQCKPFTGCVSVPGIALKYRTVGITLFPYRSLAYGMCDGDIWPVP